MHARSALFDLFGDHLRDSGSQAPVAALVRLLAPVGIAAPAVRTAISRMVIQGWLEPVALPEGRGYRTTERAARRLADTSARVYRRDDGGTGGAGGTGGTGGAGREDWDGSWHLVVVEPPAGRAARARLRADLAFLGYGELTDHVWVGPFQSAELAGVLERAGASARTARATDVRPSPVDAWDLEALRSSYEHWLSSARGLVGVHLAAHEDADEAAFAARFHLVHEWRKFLFADPGLPAAVLPDDWPRAAAAALFASESERLRPAADRFVARCLS